ncbi:hypothetical protein CEUSTIGMA_g12214.t1 [Chlamydomonas eustigma]|uniref:DNA-directed RNA polymerase n=1 Tax=Chlamydomonas eustigma TaxID=1157962 RepID=A0A250XP65_9CHLO|nr:hypothetical protein CEUSTIGMA_g12214.t1 [Chlamydomonas eustigma]|eukprot:GAX84793.1 hypothetical protein CEUSTIGMA_g12214.t1 [Chlamydomonas eustigma]
MLSRITAVSLSPVPPLTQQRYERQGGTNNRCNQCGLEDCIGHPDLLSLGPFRVWNERTLPFVVKVLGCIDGLNAPAPSQKRGFCPTAFRNKLEVLWGESNGRLDAFISTAADLVPARLKRYAFSPKLGVVLQRDDGFDMSSEDDDIPPKLQAVDIDIVIEQVKEGLETPGVEVALHTNAKHVGALIADCVFVVPEIVRPVTRRVGGDITIHAITKYAARLEDLVLRQSALSGAASGLFSRPIQSVYGRLRDATEQLVVGKAGRIRGNLLGSRVNHTARAVIVGDPNIRIHEIGVPAAIAAKLLVPEDVTLRNVHKIAAAILRGDAPVFRDDGGRLRVLRHEPPPPVGTRIYRRLFDGDVVVMNRQPSLHRMSLMAHTVRVLRKPQKDQKKVQTMLRQPCDEAVFRLNPAVTVPYNADFDGDEMNMHVPQGPAARREAAMLMGVALNMVTSASCEALVRPVQDGNTGIALLCERSDILRPEACQLLCAASLCGAAVRLPDGNNDGVWTGRQLVECLVQDKGLMHLVHPIFPLKDLVRRVWVASEDKRVAADLVDALQRLANEYLRSNGFSIDLRPDGGGPLQYMVDVGSKGKPANLAHMFRALGQQTLFGRPILRGTSHHPAGSAQAGGMVDRCLADGLSSTDLWANAVSARETLIDTSVTCPVVGRIGRQMLKCLVDIVAQEDETVRCQLSGPHGPNRIVQFLYGADGLSGLGTERVCAGTPIGCIAAQSCHEGMLQSSLNSFHSAGQAACAVGRSHVDVLSLSRLRNRVVAPTPLQPQVLLQELVDVRTAAMVLTSSSLIDCSLPPGSSALRMAADRVRAKDGRSSEVPRKLTGGTYVRAVQYRWLLPPSPLLPLPVVDAHVVAELDAEHLTLTPSCAVAQNLRQHELERVLKATVLRTTVVSGVPGILDADGSVDPERSAQTYREVLCRVSDWASVRCTCVRAVHEVLGVEAANAALLEELRAVFPSLGMRHLMLVADAMTLDGSPKPMTSTGVGDRGGGFLRRAVFEGPVQQLYAACVGARRDPLDAVDARIMLGIVPRVGTGFAPPPPQLHPPPPQHLKALNLPPMPKDFCEAFLGSRAGMARLSAAIDKVVVEQPAYTRRPRLTALVTIARIPLMLHSRHCLLHGLPDADLRAAGECPFDRGGYFVVEGGKKIVMPKEDRVRNRLYVKRGEASRPDLASFAYIRCDSDLDAFPRTATFYVRGKDAPKFPGTLTVVVTHLGNVNAKGVQRGEVPIFALFRALGVESDLDILRHIVYDVANEQDVVEFLRPSILHASDLGLRDGKSSIAWLGGLVRPTDTLKQPVQDGSQHEASLSKATQQAHKQGYRPPLEDVYLSDNSISKEV